MSGIAVLEVAGWYCRQHCCLPAVKLLFILRSQRTSGRGKYWNRFLIYYLLRISHGRQRSIIDNQQITWPHFRRPIKSIWFYVSINLLFTNMTGFSVLRSGVLNLLFRSPANSNIVTLPSLFDLLHYRLPLCSTPCKLIRNSDLVIIKKEKCWS